MNTKLAVGRPMLRTHSLLSALLLVGGCTGTIQSPDGSNPAAPPGFRGPGDVEETVPQGGLNVEVTSTSSSSVLLTWPVTEGASRVTLTLGTEPATRDDGTLEGPTETLELDSSATTHELASLAAATDVFIHVSVEQEGHAPLWGNVHARTAGGPGAELATPLRSVHGYGPSTLLVVISDPETTFDEASRQHLGDDGASWQGGTWTVSRADGSAVPVRSVHRQTVPSGQPDYPVGFEVYGDGKIVNLEHRIFLVLEEPMGERELLRVRHVGGETPLEFLLPFSDRYLETPLIQLNQVGYNPRAAQRWAYLAGYLGDGGPSDLSGIGEVAELLVDPANDLVAERFVSDLPVRQRATTDTDSGGRVLEIDLAGAPAAEETRYRIRVPGVGISWPTSVSEEASFKAFYTIARGMFHNRWCGDLDAKSTEWERDPDHCEAYFVSGYDYGIHQFPKGVPLTDLRPLRGGHHDAGDFDIRPYHVVVGQYLLRAVELGGARFGDSQLNLPESGNGIPDLLDEALWSLAGWEALQNPDGSVRAGVETWADPRGIHFADQDELPYWTWDPVPWHTAYVAALFAQGARLVAPYDAERSATLTGAAKRAYAAAVAMNAPAAYRLYAASELLALTGESQYAIAFEALWDTLDKYGNGAFDSFDSMLRLYPGSFTDHTPAMADYVLGYAESDFADAGIVTIIRRELRKLADESATAVLESAHAHRHGRPAGDAMDWGHATATGRHVDRIYQALQFLSLDGATKQRYLDAMSVSADYVLGANPLGLSFITGLGSRMPTQALHLDSLAAQATGMPAMPGIPVYGPVTSLPNVYYYWPVTDAHYPAFNDLPRGRRYADSRTSVNTAEFTVWENQAPLTELFGSLLGGMTMPPAAWLPGQPAHRATLPSQR
jgi:endoglucanase